MLNSAQMTFLKIFLYGICTAGLFLGGMTGCLGLGKNVGDDGSIEQVRGIDPATFADELSAAQYDPSLMEDLPEMTGQEHERVGDLQFRQGQYQLAFISYEKALRFYPDNTRILYKQGLLFLAGGLYENAQKRFQALIEKEPHDAQAHEGLGQAYFVLKKFDEAQESFSEAVRLDPSLWRSYVFLGIICDYQGNYTEAVAQYNKALELNLQSSLIYNNLGMSYFLAESFEEAVQAYRQALRLGAPESKTYNNLGLALSKLGRQEEALEAFRRGGDEAQAYNNVGCAYLAEGLSQQAEQSFEKAIALKPSFYEIASHNLEKCRLPASPKAAAPEQGEEEN